MALVGACRGATDEPDPSGTTPSPTSSTGLTATTGDTATPGMTDTCADSPATWETVGEPTLRTWCTPCHSENLAVDQRQGAPEGVDFDTYELTLPWVQRIVARTVDQVDMPPAGGVTQAERDALAAWVACGAPGTPTPVDPDPCAAPEWLAGTTSAGALACWAAGADVGLHIGGDLTLDADADLSCICAIDGDLVAENATDADLPLLHTVGGAVRVVGSDVGRLVAPRLEQVDHIEIDGAPQLVELDLANVRAASEVLLRSAPQLDSVLLEELASVSGSVHLEGLDAADPVSLPRLATTGGDYVVRNAPSAELLIGTHTVTSIGGDLVLEGLDSLEHIDDFSEVLSIGGDLIVRDTGTVTLHGFHRLLTIAGSVVIEDNAALERAHGLPDLQAVGGDFVAQRNASFTDWEALAFLVDVGGDFVIHDHPRLQSMPRFQALTTVQGDFTFTQNALIPSIDAQAIVDRITVGGTVTIADNRPP